jgi:hypothetical protein
MRCIPLGITTGLFAAVPLDTQRWQSTSEDETCVARYASTTHNSVTEQVRRVAILVAAHPRDDSAVLEQPRMSQTLQA